MSEKRTFKVSAMESYCTTIYREEITINVDDYPQLEGMTDEEILEFVQFNASDIYKKGDEENGYSLWDEMIEQDIERERIKGEEVDVIIEKDEEDV